MNKTITCSLYPWNRFSPRTLKSSLKSSYKYQPHERDYHIIYLSPVKRRDIGLDLSVRPSVCPSVCLSVRLSHREGGCLVDITSPSLDVPRGVFSSYLIQPRIIDVQRQGFSLIEVKLSELQPSELSPNSCFICA